MMPQPQSTGTGQSVNVSPQMHAQITSNFEKLEADLRQATGSKDTVLKGAQVTLTVDPTRTAQTGTAAGPATVRVALEAPPQPPGRDNFNLLVVVEILGRMAQDSNAIAFKVQLAKVHDAWEVYSYQQEQGNKQVDQSSAILASGIIGGAFNIAGGTAGVVAPFTGVTGTQIGYPLQTGVSGGGQIGAAFFDAEKTKLEADVTIAGSNVTIYQSSQQVDEATAENIVRAINEMFQDMRSTASSVLGMVEKTGSRG